jgi:hypothetical protein
MIVEDQEQALVAEEESIMDTPNEESRDDLGDYLSLLAWETEYTKAVKTEEKFPIQPHDLQFKEAFKLACGGVAMESGPCLHRPL